MTQVTAALEAATIRRSSGMSGLPCNDEDPAPDVRAESAGHLPHACPLATAAARAWIVEGAAGATAMRPHLAEDEMGVVPRRLWNSAPEHGLHFLRQAIGRVI